MILTFEIIQNFLNTNLGVVTFIVGFLAIYLYVKQKVDRKRDAAKLILQEIRYAEQQIRKYREVGKYLLTDKLLPTNSWNENIHLFIKHLKETDIDLISAFYARSAYIDVLITKISDWKNQPTPILIRSIPPMQIPSAMTHPIPTPTPNSNPGHQPIPQASLPPSFDPMESTQNILREISMNIEFIYNTTTVERLRKISKRKWFYLM